MKIEDGFDAQPKAKTTAMKQPAISTGLAIIVVSVALLTGVIGYVLGSQTSGRSGSSMQAMQGAPGGMPQQSGTMTPPQAGSSTQQSSNGAPPAQTQNAQPQNNTNAASAADSTSPST